MSTGAIIVICIGAWLAFLVFLVWAGVRSKESGLDFEDSPPRIVQHYGRTRLGQAEHDAEAGESVDVRLPGRRAS